MCSDSEKNMSAFADQNHAPSLTCVRLELIGNYVEIPIKQKHFVQTMRTRTRRNDCFAIVLGADKKDVLLMILSARVCDNTLSCENTMVYHINTTTYLTNKMNYSITKTYKT